jgi:hypothetical protein
MNPYASRPRQKGGTRIVEDATDLERHRIDLLDPDRYRPAKCPRCGHPVLHAKDFRERRPRDLPWFDIRRYKCASKACGAIWRILPAFIARHLHRAWPTIEVAVTEEGALSPPPKVEGKRPPEVPARTMRRYLGRLSLTAVVLRSAFAAAEAAVARVLCRLVGEASRAAFCQAFADAGLVAAPRRLEGIATWTHRIVPGLRLM